MLRAEIQRALRRAPRQLRRLARLANSPGFKSFRCPRWRIKFSLERFSDPSRFRLRIQPLKNSSGQVPQARRLSHALRIEMGKKCRKTTRVAHFRGSTLQCLRESACASSRYLIRLRLWHIGCKRRRWKTSRIHQICSNWITAPRITNSGRRLHF